MKKLFYSAILIIFSFVQVYSQIPEKFNYQGVLRNSTGELVKNSSITVKISLLQGSTSGIVLYSESHAVGTNNYGQFTLQVGSGAVLFGTFNTIDWSQQMYQKTEVANPAGGTFVNMSTVQLLSVPYALYAKNVANKDDADADPANELQNLILSKDTLEISGGNRIVFPYDSSYWAINVDKLYYNSGNVGIGSNDPSSKLEVKSSGTGALFQVINANNDTVFAVYPDGVKVFVDPDVKGRVGGFAVSGRTPTKDGTTVEYFRVTPDSTRVWVNDSIGTKGKIGGFAVSGRTPTKGIINDYLFVTSDSTRIYVNDSISGKSSVGGFAVSGRTPTKGEIKPFMEMTKNNYFIGHEAGKSNTEGLYNSYLGYEAGYLNTAGRNGMFIGYRAGYNNTTGNFNAFFGNYSGFNNTEGYSNVFIGDSTGKNNTIGASNIFIGKEAGKMNINGGLNTFIGEQAGAGNISGIRNIFIGMQAGASNSTGRLNIYIGAVAGPYNTIGERNVFIGQSSGYFIDSSSFNVFIGDGSGAFVKKGNSNVYIGRKAGQYNDYGNSNTCIGENSGTSSDGSNNVFLGFNSGRTAISNNVILGSYSGYNSYGSNNIFIGYRAGYSEVVSSNRLYIESSNANSDSTLIYGEFDNDLLKLNARVNIRDFMILQPRDTAPASPAKGTVYFDSNDNKAKMWDGTAWQSLW